MHEALETTSIGTDKAQKTSMLLDMGIKNYLNNSFSINPLDPIIMTNVVLQELYKNISTEQNILTYKKINGSSIDFILTDNKGERITAQQLWSNGIKDEPNASPQGDE